MFSETQQYTMKTVVTNEVDRISLEYTNAHGTFDLSPVLNVCSTFAYVAAKLDTHIKVCWTLTDVS